MSSFKAFDTAINAVNRVFGTSVSYTHIGDLTSVTINAVFDKKHVEVNGVSSLTSILTIRLADLPKAPDQGDTVVVGSYTYNVGDVQPDAFGSALLILRVG